MKTAAPCKFARTVLTIAVVALSLTAAQAAETPTATSSAGSALTVIHCAHLIDTDAGVYPHGENAQEFVYMVRAGMPPMYVIQAATTHAATLLKHSQDFGRVAPGKYADVVAVPGNPLDDITLMKKVDFVMKAGTVYK